MDKNELRNYFSKNWHEYYYLDFFKEYGFKRKQCIKCKRFFWTLDENRNTCNDSSCDGYSFIGKKIEDIDYIEAWKKIENFFIKNGHESIRRYPVVARWFPDLYFVVASVVNFYRKVNGNIDFELPADKVIVPQFCLRFNDLENVGITGRHYVSFVMVGQHTIPEQNGYWKDETIRLDFELLTKEFKIDPIEITFIEDVWIGSQAFGYSLEYFVRGLELGNAVFTEFEFYGNSFRRLSKRFVDMGAGLERFPWLLSGKPNSYLITFEPVINFIIKSEGIRIDDDFLFKFHYNAGYFDLTEIDIEDFYKNIGSKIGLNIEEIKNKINLYSSIFRIADFSRALLLAINDGALPSNVGGGYNLRIILRKMLKYYEQNKFNFDLIKIFEILANQLEYFDNTLKESIDVIQKVIEVEKKKYQNTKQQAIKVVKKILSEKGKLEKDDIRLLYESFGVRPEFLEEELGIRIDKKIIEDIRKKEEIRIEERKINVPNIEVKEMYYDDIYEFEAKIEKIIDNYVILDRTAFFPTQGGQKYDTGYIENSKVIEVIKVGKTILHKVDSIENLKEGQIVKCKIDVERRKQLTIHHDSAHIILAAARKVLGKHVWQAGAEKDVDKARIDITHFENLSEKQIEEIENYANEIVNKNLKIEKEILDRSEAEKKYGFRIYQGGYVPEKKIRIVKIGDIDIEACSGTHGNNTKEIGLIKIISTKKISDDIIRIEFVAGDAAIKFLKEKEKILDEICNFLNCSYEEAIEKVKNLFNLWKERRKKIK
ncbi:MAG: alanine--tRNA ligase-related protein [Candidatus Aenigmatarchaeota archaeon]